MSCEWSEKRQSPRIPVDLEVDYSQQGKTRQGNMLNLSLDGCLLRTSELFDPGDQLEITFQLPGVPESLRVKSSVAWGGMIEGANTRSFGIGIHFVELGASSKEQIDQFLHNLLKT